MANIPLHFSATVEDGFNVRKSTDAYLDLPDTTTLAQLAAACQTWISDLDAVISGAIISNLIRVVPALPGGIKGATGSTWAASRVNQTGLFRFDVTGTSARWSFVAPSIANSVLTAGKIDLSNTAVGNLITLFTTSGNHYTNPENQQIIDCSLTAVTTRKTRKQSFNKSNEAG
jgi:hypothetical protein